MKDDIKFIKLNTKSLRSAVFRLAKIIRSEKADMVFCTIPNYNTIAILSRIFSFTRDNNIVREAAFLGAYFRSNMKRRVMGMHSKLSGKVVALSNGVKENTIKLYKVKPENIRVIYNPVDVGSITEHMENGQMAKEHEYVFQDEAKVIITAGRLVNDKDHETLINAFSKVQEEINTRLVILGEGELEESLKNQAEALQLQDKIHFLGFQHNPYVYFKHAELFVLSSPRADIGHVLTEASATRT